MPLRAFIISVAESLAFAWHSVRNNLLRTLLSLLGITIGVFCIIGIFTFVDSIELTVKSSLSRFGTNIILVQKYPWEFGPEYPFWKYEGRPEIKYSDMQQLQERFPDASAISFNLFIGDNKLESRSNTLEGVLVRAVTEDYDDIVDMKFKYGRFFSEMEANQGARVIVLGHDLAEGLFRTAEHAVGQEIEVLDRKLKVIGVLAKEGKAMGIGGQQDRISIVPLNFARSILSAEKGQFGPSIFVKGRPGIPAEELEDNLRGTLRGIRRLSPRDEDNFALNKMTMFTNFLSGLFRQINMYGWVIAGFSILVGGFGIANIMFVSVKERTNIIGIQKALGAKNYVILVQFLAEAVLLCLLGGLVGLGLIWLMAKGVSGVLGLKLILTAKNIMLGVGISSLIGILAGFFPSYVASRLDPIEAIRQGI